MKNALITGITGQDGAYLAEFLLRKGYKVFGVYRRTSSPNFWRLLSLGIKDKIEFIAGDMTDMASITNAIISSEPDEIYNLAAQSFVGASFEQPILTANVDGIGVLHVLEAVKQINKNIRIYHASSSELYGNSLEMKIDKKGLSESDVFWPASPYAAAKLYSYHSVRIYREAYGMYAVNGILFNHESPLRGLEFVTRKITNSLARIKLGLQKNIELGNINARRDWGYAGDYVEAMWRMLQQPDPSDFVIATGKSYTVREFLVCACEILGMDPKSIIKQNDRFYRPIDVNDLVGDASKAHKILNWSPNTSFSHLVEIMVKKDLERWMAHQKGEIFPWDALNDPGSY